MRCAPNTPFDWCNMKASGVHLLLAYSEHGNAQDRLGMQPVDASLWHGMKLALCFCVHFIKRLGFHKGKFSPQPFLCIFAGHPVQRGRMITLFAFAART